MHDGIKLTAPLSVSGDEIDRALLEQAKHEPAVARAYEHLRRSAALAADQLNHVLDINLFEALVRGWATVHSVRDAVQRSVLTPGPPPIVELDSHDITSTSHPVLNMQSAQTALPELRFTLQLIAHLSSATLAVRDGQIELVALGDASVSARLTYRNVLLKAHAAGVQGALRDPFRRQRSAPARRQELDFYI